MLHGLSPCCSLTTPFPLFYHPSSPAFFALTEKKPMMQTLNEWETVLVKDFLELKHLGGQDAVARMRRSMKEQEIGQHCCQAGESLSDADLTSLKEALGLNEQQWHAYKSKVRPGPA
jgi:hypothetical protein